VGRWFEMRIVGIAIFSVVVAVAASSAGASGVTAPTLGDSFLMTFTVKANKNFGAPAGTHLTGLLWYFQPRCNSGACSVEVSATPGACVSGTCPRQWPGGLLWSHEPLRYSAGAYKGTFSVKSNCFVADIPYAYRQQTKVRLQVSRSTMVGTSLKASRVLGTLTVVGTPDSYSLAHGCQPYSGTLTFRGTRRG
jgi:hypothetical protein